MKQLDLNAINSLRPHQTQRPEPVRPGNPGSTNNSTAEQITDVIEVSSQAREIAQLVDRAKSLADVREDRVEALRQLVQSGKYDVSSKEIAEAILRDEL